MRNSKKNNNPFPRSHMRREIIIDFLNDLGPDISEFGSEVISNEYNIHDLENVVNSIFYQERNRLSYLECLKILEVLFTKGLKNKEQPFVFELVSA